MSVLVLRNLHTYLLETISAQWCEAKLAGPKSKGVLIASDWDSKIC